jgi:UDP-N-acetylmuramyl pentapeptide synthase
LKSAAVLEDLNIATSCALQLGLTLAQIRTALQVPPAFSRHRLHIFNYQSASIIDDTYNANPDSMQAALLALQNSCNSSSKIAILGTMLELGELSEVEHFKLGKLARESGLEQLYWIGDYFEAVSAGFTDNRKQTTENSSGIASISSDSAHSDSAPPSTICHLPSDIRHLPSDICHLPSTVHHLENLEQVTTLLKKLSEQPHLILLKASYGIKLWEVIEKLESES